MYIMKQFKKYICMCLLKKDCQDKFLRWKVQRTEQWDFFYKYTCRHVFIYTWIIANCLTWNISHVHRNSWIAT